MKNSYTLIFFTLITSFLTAQKVDFTTAEGFTSGPLYNQTGWDSQFTGTTWTVNPSTGMTLVSGEYQRAAWEQGFSVSGSGESITFRVDLKFLGTFGTNSNALIRIGFSDDANVGSAPFPTNNGVFLRTANFNSQLQLGNNGNIGALSPNASLLIVDCQAGGESDDLAVLVTLTLGAAATSSTISAKLINLTDGTESAIGSYTSIEPSLFTAATSNIYGYFQSSSFKSTGGGGALTEIQVSSVTMTQGDTFTNTNNDNQWATAANWDSGSVPSLYTDVSITTGQTIEAENATTALANTIVVNSGGSLTIDQTSSLTVSDDFTNNGTVTLNSGGCLIVNGTSSGNVTYNRNLGTTNWYLMSSPLAGETYNDAYITANSIDLGTGSNRGIGTYTSSSDSWAYMQTGDVDATFNQGQGYAVKRSAAGDVSFTGTLNVANAGVDVVLSSDGNRFNLLGNPYTSHINSATFLANEGAVSETKTLWVWNQANGAYEVKTLADAMVIAPAQGFFVKANMGGGTFNFDESNQDSSGGTFQRTEARPEMVLTLSDQSDVREAKIYYIENMTLGFDVGYEGELFNGVSNPLAIFTHLIADSEGENYQVQSLPDNDFENTIIPLGINAISGSSISIEASKNNFPEGMNIYLEDKQDNSFTLLEADANFNTTLENDLSGIGRFFLHTTSSTLSANDLATSNNLSIYSFNRETLRVVGVQNGTANLQIFNLLGKEVLRSSFQGSGVNDISLPKLALGVYIVKVNMQTGQLNKKIIIE